METYDDVQVALKKAYELFEEEHPTADIAALKEMMKDSLECLGEAPFSPISIVDFLESAHDLMCGDEGFGEDF